jgi:hypothetical protein
MGMCACVKLLSETNRCERSILQMLVEHIRRHCVQIAVAHTFGMSKRGLLFTKPAQSLAMKSWKEKHS